MISQVLNPLFLFFDGIFQPLLALGPYISLGVFSASLAGLFAVIYRILLDIERADEIKDKMSDYQDKMKEARKNDEHEKASKHMKKSLKLNQKFMMLNLKPMLATVVFVGLLFPWLGNTYAPSIDMNQTEEDTFQGQLDYAGQSQQINVSNTTEEILVQVDGSQAAIKESLNALGVDWQVSEFETLDSGQVDANLKLNADFVPLPVSLPYIGDRLNWLGYYFILIMPLTYVFRKLLGVQ